MRHSNAKINRKKLQKCKGQCICNHVHTHTQQTGEACVVSRGAGRSLLLVDGGLGSPDSAGPAGGDETDLLTGGAAAAHSGGLTDMLVVTTTVGMLNGIHRHTAHLGIGRGVSTVEKKTFRFIFKKYPVPVR